MPWLLRQVARTGSRELFTLCVLAVALGIAFASARNDMSLLQLYVMDADGTNHQQLLSTQSNEQSPAWSR